MDFNMETAAELDRVVPASTRKYLLVGKKIIRSGNRLCINGTDEVKNINFTAEEIKDIDSDAKLQIFINRKLNKTLDMTQVDMLTNTGYTQVMQPVKPEIVHNPSDEPLEVVSRDEAVAAPIENKAAPVEEQAPVLMPQAAKTLELSKKPDKQSGLADIVVLSIIVLVYVAIIVNLVIRLK